MRSTQWTKSGRLVNNADDLISVKSVKPLSFRAEFSKIYVGAEKYRYNLYDSNIYCCVLSIHRKL